MALFAAGGSRLGLHGELRFEERRAFWSSPADGTASASSRSVSSSLASGFHGAVLTLSTGSPRCCARGASVCRCSPSAMISAEKGPRTLSFFIHEKRTSPDLTLVSVAEPGTPLEASKLKFGSVFLYDNIIRDTESADGTVLGSETGTVGLTRDNTSFYMSQVFNLSAPTYSGSLALQGRFYPASSCELIITGGTGDFRFARGYATTNLVPAACAPDQSYVVFKYDISLRYD